MRRPTTAKTEEKALPIGMATPKTDKKRGCLECIFCSNYRKIADNQIYIQCSTHEWAGSTDSFIVPLELITDGCIRYSGRLFKYRQEQEAIKKKKS